MKTTKAILSAFALMTALAVAAPAQTSPNPNPGNGSPRMERRGGTNQGKKAGPQDGSGPIHQPGTGGGSGAGNRRGRK